ncbi:sugar ABC transporter permease [Paenibacillus chitinolyticus]|uniref:ABC transporter permease subunit n=1 Tax=Paenibacillus chitinolyticus TaxID=79263 RepID=A0A410WZ36_9BACL|nr:ABC transporter permease subunit [Paenibacillus chitinolyticus]MCY9590288.1 ABC transporter permease subunit [Paenibacillus chitinolyticus]MCY9596984.1 ABC transporter permease subunit [Paenibacillus chitinolyticus]QAV19715.1 sugar ABC transporter permease [Paenibacillus chitinolyticus]
MGVNTVQQVNAGKARRTDAKKGYKQPWILHFMVLPAEVLVFIFSYIPMSGIVMAFQDYKPALGISGSPWVGLKHFRYMWENDYFLKITWNTLFFACSKMVMNLIIPFFFALLLNEVRKMALKRTIQTLVYLPHFLSWVTLSGILIDMLAQTGLINQFLAAVFGIKPIFFLGDGNWFRFTIIFSDVWKEFGFNTIIFLAALSGINPSLYEAAEVDGAGRWKQTFYITIPALIPITIVIATLALGNVLNANFDQVFNLYSPLIYQQGDIIDTFVYREGLLSGQFSFATAVSLFKSFISLILIAISYRLAYRFAGYRIF